MTISMQSRIVRSDGPVTAPVDDELVMADIDAGKYYGFNNIATAIWENLETQITVKELCRKLCEQYDVTAEQCEKEVMDFLKKLETRDLISVRE